MKSEIIPPSTSLLESMRSVGYSLEAALADLVDNSISAGARCIEIDLEPVGADHIAILDNGAGMSPEVAVEALRLAGMVGERAPTDLGRFGLGLKTASLSQARCLTVVTKARGAVTGLRWDIDHVAMTGQWSLLRLEETEIQTLYWADKLRTQESGTLVVWHKLDLLLADAPDRSSLIKSCVPPLIDSLGLVFHRFLHNRTGGITIKVNGNNVEPCDPFLISNPKTQRSPTQCIPIGGAQVMVTAFTLPHATGLTPDERKRPDLGETMREGQGFYIYRNERLVSHGHWYGLARMDDISKQTRIQVDVPNTIDHLWQLDIKKSRAEPPTSFRSELRRLLAGVIEKGKRVHTYRGRKEIDPSIVRLWEKIRERDGFRYGVNLESPLVAELIQELSPSTKQKFIYLIESLADSFPIHDSFAEMAGNTPVVRAQREVEATLEVLRAFRDSSSQRPKAESIIAMLAHAEPFNTMEKLHELVLQVWKEDTHDIK